MKMNQSDIERVIRGIVGLVLLVLTVYVTGILQIVLAVVGAALLVTGIIGFCPLYKLIGRNTRGK
jgi:uncharacterized membrane protein